MERIGLLSAQKDEGPFLLEFVAHHLAIGFSDVYLVTNPSSDGTNELATALADAGVIGHLIAETPFGAKPQDYAFAQGRSVFRLEQLDWLLVLDCDELLNIHSGDGSVSQFLQGFPQSVNLVSINMACFGDWPHSRWVPGVSSSQFLYRLASDHWRNGAAKTFIRQPGRFGGLRPHGPRFFYGDGCVDIALHGGLSYQSQLPWSPASYDLLRRPGSSDSAHSLAQINHYAVRTWDAFQLRAARGRGAAPVGTPNRRHSRAYFKDLSVASLHDDTILRYRSRFLAVWDHLLSHHEIRFRHEEAMRSFSLKLAALS